MNAEALSRYFARVAPERAALGRLDCVRFVSEALLIGWGRDHRAALGYHDRATAIARLRRDGGLWPAVDRALGERRLLSELEPGDVAALAGPAVGLVMPGDRVLLKYRRSLQVLPLSAAPFGWRS